MFRSVQTLPYVDPLMPVNENIPAKLARLSSNITSLTRLIEEAQRRGLEHLTTMFARTRQRDVDQALTCMGTDEHEASSHFDLR